VHTNLFFHFVHRPRFFPDGRLFAFSRFFFLASRVPRIISSLHFCFLGPFLSYFVDPFSTQRCVTYFREPATMRRIDYYKVFSSSVYCSFFEVVFFFECVFFFLVPQLFSCLLSLIERLALFKGRSVAVIFSLSYFYLFFEQVFSQKIFPRAFFDPPPLTQICSPLLLSVNPILLQTFFFFSLHFSPLLEAFPFVQSFTFSSLDPQKNYHSFVLCTQCPRPLWKTPPPSFQFFKIFSFSPGSISSDRAPTLVPAGRPLLCIFSSSF